MRNPPVAGDDDHYDERPWGNYTVLDEGNGYKVKRIVVLPGKRLSYQKHTQRGEHWMMVQGTGRVTLEGAVVDVPLGATIDIPQGAAHRIENPGDEPLIFIEIQRGAYLGEDDIIRIEDDFGRAGR
ncbi:MAG: mannose-6-phosphate isomerase [Chloroflexi bacterium]|nr:MAG: mannose-6-phosphate isomerase [Chloroflexota bacterium]